MQTNNTVHDAFDSNAQEYQDRFMDVSAYHSALGRLIGQLPDQASILDLACGPGNISKYIHENHAGKSHITGIDFSERMIKLARINLPDGHFIRSNVLDLDKLNLGKQDAIVLGFCLPYLNMDECRLLFAKISTICNRKACLYIAVNLSHAYTVRKHSSSDSNSEITSYLYSPGDVKALLDQSGFRMLWSSYYNTRDTGNPDNEWIVLAECLS